MKHESVTHRIRSEFSSEKNAATSLIFSQQRITMSTEKPVNLDKFITTFPRFSGAEEIQEEGVVL